MGSIFGRFFRVSTFGESHGSAMGVVVDGVPAGLPLDADRIQKDLEKRRPGTSDFVSKRQETDQVEVLSGLAQGKTLGTPIALVVRNRDARPDDYQELTEIFRPGHADYTYFHKYGVTPQPGGGRSSGRETVARVAAGAVARALLKTVNVSIRAYTVRIGTVSVKLVDTAFAERDPLRCSDPEAAEAMADEVRAAQADNDSVGGIVELAARGVPVGWGDPVFDKLDAVMGGAMLFIGGVKAVEVGDGFAVAERRGSQNNDQMVGEGFLSNHAGGILGGISTGQTILLRIAVKPTPSIALEQQTMDIQGRQRTVEIKGRHDPCLCPRVAPVAEAMAALVLADAWLDQRARQRGNQ